MLHHQSTTTPHGRLSLWPPNLTPLTQQQQQQQQTTLVHAQSEESGIEPGLHIATITGSLASFPGLEPEALYDTDHTDLHSDTDESELRHELLRGLYNFFCYNHVPFQE